MFFKFINHSNFSNMKIFNKIKGAVLLVVTASLFNTACNKAPLPPVPLPIPANGTTPTLATLLDNPDSSFTFLKAAVVRAGLLPALSSPTVRYTVFAPDNNAFILSGIPSVAVINSLPVATVVGLVSYHVIPQVIASSSIPTNFPNFEYPSILNPTTGTPAFNPLVRLTNFPSKRGGAAWVNNIPVITTDISAVNGVLHKVAALVAPPSKYLWDDISTNSDLTYLKAAIIRADSGVAVAGRLQTALSSFGVNLTILAPTDAAFRATLTGAITQALIPIITQQLIPIITAQLIAGGATPDQAAAQAPVIAAAQAPGIAQTQASSLAATPNVFSNPALYGALTAQTVKGIIVYHILGTAIPGIRVFTVNMPTTPTLVKTLLNQAVAEHKGVSIQATFTGPFVSAATVKGLANATAANLILPADRNAINGVLHKIDQVLMPL
jgi:uncharacterized surface protein with fasciclin (FAS1) repeats